ncbi:MAG: hypothetical protein HGA39_09325 [Coriobacteriia bacterium]|nr:hypothetical protein [Coriobacteriia bacterium]
MNEGWHGDEYYIIFGEGEIADATQRYRVAQEFPEHSVMGLRGWDDLIVCDSEGQAFAVPSVPLDARHVLPCNVPEAASLEADSRFVGLVKWYVTPIVFGGDPQAQDNITWVSHEQHSELVAWWNERYRELKGNDAGA